MLIRIVCTTCGHEWPVPTVARGARIACPKCRSPYVLTPPIPALVCICDAALRVAEEDLGTRIQCSQCSAVLYVPDTRARFQGRGVESWIAAIERCDEDRSATIERSRGDYDPGSPIEESLENPAASQVLLGILATPCTPKTKCRAAQILFQIGGVDEKNAAIPWLVQFARNKGNTPIEEAYAHHAARLVAELVGVHFPRFPYGDKFDKFMRDLSIQAMKRIRSGITDS